MRSDSAIDVLDTSRRGSLFVFVATAGDSFIVKYTYKLFVYNLKTKPTIQWRMNIVI
jgi:hypothetical protein